MSGDKGRDLLRLAHELVGQGELQQAKRVLKGLTDLEPDDHRALHALGVVHARLREWRRARASLQRALSIRPGYPPARKALSMVDRRLGSETGEEEGGSGTAVAEAPEPRQEAPAAARPSEQRPDPPATEDDLPVLEVAEDDVPVLGEVEDSGDEEGTPAVDLDTEWVNAFAEGRADASPPMFAELSFRAGAAVWAVLVMLMAIFATLRGGGVAGALIFMAVAAGVYALGTFVMYLLTPAPIEPGTDEPQEARIYGLVERLARRSDLPMPNVALSPDEGDVNAYTFGLTRSSARIVVTRGFLSHVQPTDEELEAVLAHELGHIHHRDVIVSTLLRFPIWLMDKIRFLLYIARAIGQVVLQIASVFAFGLVGAIMILMIVGFLLYLSLWIGLLTAAIFLTVLFVTAFEREREYVADLYSANLIGDQRALQTALGKLGLATERIAGVISERAEEAGEGEEVDTEVAAPEKAFDGRRVVAVALAGPPSLEDSLSRAEFLETHPLTEKRIYYLSHPEEHHRLLTRAVSGLGRAADRLLGPSGGEERSLGLATALIGFLAGTVFGALPAVVSERTFLIADVAVTLIMGLVLAVMTRLGRWDGGTLVRRALLMGFVAATAFLVAGVVAGADEAWIFPAVFVDVAFLSGLIGALVGRLLRGKPTEAGTPSSASEA
ncbi:MAG: M48 family metalloprotease [Candidatus Brocadiaceae bacterium]